MNKNTQYLLGGILIVLFAFLMFNMDITGFAEKAGDGDISISITDEMGIPKVMFERGEMLYATVNVGKGKEIMNRDMEIYEDKKSTNPYVDAQIRDALVENTKRRICGVGSSYCAEGSYTIKYRLAKSAKTYNDGDYYVRVEEHLDPKHRTDINDHIYVTKEFTINGPKTCPQVDGIYTC